jgi:hypothetical protein
MFEPVRVAFVMEGPTDYVALRAAVRALLNGRDFEPTVIWPELDENLAAQSAGGWGGVYKWCRQAVEQAGGPVRSNPIFELHDVLVIQVDADVARSKYSDYKITDAPNNDLPCQKDCPPPSATTDALRAVMLGWLSEDSMPPGAVLCTPSKSIETWVLVALFPNDESAKKSNIECRWDGEVRLRKYGLIRSGQKLVDEYEANEDGIRAAWPGVRGKCSEAERFSQEFLALVPAN